MSSARSVGFLGTSCSAVRTAAGGTGNVCRVEGGGSMSRPGGWSERRRLVLTVSGRARRGSRANGQGICVRCAYGDRSESMPEPFSADPMQRTKPDGITKTGASVSWRSRLLYGLGRFALTIAFLLWPLLPSVPFTVLLAVACVVSQFDYYKIAVSQGHLPATRTGIITTVLMIVLLLTSPPYADAVVPICGTLICCYLLFRKRPRIATIADLSTTLAGLFYAGLLPSFFIRLHQLNNFPLTPLEGVLHRLGFYATDYTARTGGSLIIFVTFAVKVAADHIRRLSLRILPEGQWRDAIGTSIGFVSTVAMTMGGVRALNWPCWIVSGALYGIVLALCGLIGRLTKPMFRRADDARDGTEDSLASYPSIFDQTDSYVFIAPLAYYFVLLCLPLATRMLP